MGLVCLLIKRGGWYEGWGNEGMGEGGMSGW